MKLKTLFILGDIGYLNYNLQSAVTQISQQIMPNDIITLLGDNFYPSGVSSLKDPQWDKYNEIFKEIKNPVYSVLGNHDYLLNPKAQIFSPNWKMDGWYFKKEFDNIDLYFLDTNQFALEWVSEEILHQNHNLFSNDLIKNQLNWLENEFKKNINKRKILIGHYPILTNGYYIDKMDKLYDALINLFQKYNVTLYISGHEHNIQHINRKIDELDFTQVIIGSSSEVRDDVKNCQIIDMLNNKETFFGKLTINSDNFLMQYFNSEGVLKYEYYLNFCKDTMG